MREKEGRNRLAQQQTVGSTKGELQTRSERIKDKGSNSIENQPADIRIRLIFSALFNMSSMWWRPCKYVDPEEMACPVLSKPKPQSDRARHPLGQTDRFRAIPCSTRLDQTNNVPVHRWRTGPSSFLIFSLFSYQSIIRLVEYDPRQFVVYQSRPSPAPKKEG